MKPKFKNIEDWQKAEQLMQPALIRVMDNLRQEIEKCHGITATYEEVQTPYPGYQVSLTYQETSAKISIWEICFKVCFLNYELSVTNEQKLDKDSQVVDIDSSLIDDTGGIEWKNLDLKAQGIIQEILANLSLD
ncbi:MAG TPA: hypothetical protein DCF68_06540 [Cyanothece sp. UBA12306]|nr:hypothetical protein [Cyanothece sp. UBA12306]